MWKKLVIVGTLVLAWLQYGLWFGQSGHFTEVRLEKQLALQTQRVDVVKSRNAILLAEVVAMKSDVSLLEGRARRELGMIKPGEVFYLVPESN